MNDTLAATSHQFRLALLKIKASSTILQEKSQARLNSLIVYKKPLPDNLLIAISKPLVLTKKISAAHNDRL